MAASACAVAAGVVVAVGWRDDTSELGMLGSFTMAVSVLPLVHGITTPGVWYGPNDATMLPVWPMGSVASIGVGVAAMSVCGALSYRQLRLAMIAGSWKPLVVSVGFVFVGVSSLVWVGRAPFTLGFWLAHGFDITGVLLLALGSIRVLRQRKELRQVLRPLTVHTPLAAFELGLDPLVTRDHVVRSAELAMAVGERLGIDGHDLQLLGLGALLHDIGKLEVADEILNKDGRLTPAEYEIIKAHAAAGDALVRASVVLAPIGPIVRGHHERYDGTGYPDGLSGSGIPLMARVVSVCDAFDAMAQTRQYRQGMGEERAISILREHAGSQWDPEAVEALVAVVGDGRVERGELADVGRRHDDSWVQSAGRCGCADALPPIEAVAEFAVAP